MTLITDFAGTKNNNTQAVTDVVAVRLWLYSICVLIFIMVIVGGATRLTDSGLSITEWKPILGVIPPLTENDWQIALEKYRQIPEYQIVNKGMSMAEFQFIYWWEWGHRFLGRFIGIAFFIPFLFFWLTNRLSPPLTYKLLAVFVLGGLQGFMGWYMVQSGLSERIDVSQYRLAAHLGLAVIIFGCVYWLARSLRSDDVQASTQQAASSISSENAKHMFWAKISAYGLMIGIFFQIILGAFVAGLHAGRSHNTWPLMDGQTIPDGLFQMSPWYLNFFENVMTVQFDHRMMAYLLVIWSFGHVYLLVKAQFHKDFLNSASLIVLAMLAQTAMGIWTLLAHVPIGLGLLHQGGALIVLLFAMRHAHMLHQVAHQNTASNKVFQKA